MDIVDAWAVARRRLEGAAYRGFTLSILFQGGR